MKIQDGNPPVFPRALGPGPGPRAARWSRALGPVHWSRALGPVHWSRALGPVHWSRALGPVPWSRALYRSEMAPETMFLDPKIKKSLFLVT